MEGKMPEGAEAQIDAVLRSRMEFFMSQADSLTLEGVRRILEKDMGLEKFSLDVHKKFIKDRLHEFFEGASNKSTEGSGMLQKTCKPEKDNREHEQESSTTNEEKDNVPADGVSIVSAAMVKDAIKKRAPYIKTNSVMLTMKDLRRDLEEDLGLDKTMLDPYRAMISEEVNKILQSLTEEQVEGNTGEIKKSSRKKEGQKAGKVSKRDRANSSQSHDEDLLSKKKTVKRKSIAKRPKEVIAEESSFAKKELDTEVSKEVNKKIEKASNTEGDASSSDDCHKQRPMRKQDKPAQLYGKRVEHLKSIIKLCGMSVAPTVYRRVKQEPEGKREAFLVKQLEEMLEKEGLSSNPSEKEIKDVRRRKERAKELEGIDLSNIIPSSRRRAASSYIPLPKPKIESDSEEDEDEDGDEDDDQDDGEKEHEDNGDDDNEGAQPLGVESDSE